MDQSELNSFEALTRFVTKMAPHIARFELVAWRSTLYEELTCDTMTGFKEFKL